MTWKITGPQCRENGCNRPVFEENWCRLHYELAAAFGYTEKRSEPPPLTEAAILDHQSHEFSKELDAWRQQEAA